LCAQRPNQSIDPTASCTQIIDLKFHRKFMRDPTDPKAQELIEWPHVTINTLVKQ
jgi:hypothetical protein